MIEKLHSKTLIITNYNHFTSTQNFRGKPGNELQNLAMRWGVGDHPLLKVFWHFLCEIHTYPHILQNVSFQGGSHLPIFPPLHIPWEQGHPWNQHCPHCWGKLQKEKNQPKDSRFMPIENRCGWTTTRGCSTCTDPTSSTQTLALWPTGSNSKRSD